MRQLHQELENLVTISNQEEIHVNDIQQIIDLFKYGWLTFFENFIVLNIHRPAFSEIS